MRNNISKYIAILSIALLSFSSCSNKTAPQRLDVPIDTSYNDNLVDTVVFNNDSITLLIDSLVNQIAIQREVNKQLTDSISVVIYQRDSLNEALFVSDFKLLRIREYNRIAAQGNNITFLRGWINRVLKD